MNEQQVEMYVGYTNHRWDTFIISVPLLTFILNSDAEFRQIAEEVAQKELFNNSNTEDEVAFVGIYNIMDEIKE